ncbi:MAG TPA: hypothetical protein VF761_06255 [Gemmatimonadaceae bacterium]
MYLTLVSGDYISRAQSNGGTQPDLLGRNADGTTWQCGPSVHDYCYRYSGSGHVDVTPLPAVTPRMDVDSPTVAIGQTVRFTIRRDTVEGYVLPIDIDSVGWTPAAPGDGGESTEATKFGACQFASLADGSLQCAKKIKGAGSLNVTLHVNGFRKTVGADVAIKGNATLTLTAVPSAVKSGNNVTFTARWTDDSTVVPWQWQWYPDSGASTVGGCSSGSPICVRSITQSGTMEIQSYRNNVLRTARAHVNALPCPPINNDSVLNDASVRRDIAGLMRASHPELSPEENLNASNWNDPNSTNTRKERAMWIVRRANGDYYTVPGRLTSTTGCSSTVDPNQEGDIVAGLQPGDRIVAYVHTHPALPNDPLYGDCIVHFGGGANLDYPMSRYPNDPNPLAILPGFWGNAGNTLVDGGGSDADWNAPRHYDEYVVDVKPDHTSGEVFKLPVGWPIALRQYKLDERHWPWNPACGWQ